MSALENSFRVDEIVVATFADTAEDRLRSYELLAGLFDIGERKPANQNAAARTLQ